MEKESCQKSNEKRMYVTSYVQNVHKNVALENPISSQSLCFHVLNGFGVALCLRTHTLPFQLFELHYKSFQDSRYILKIKLVKAYSLLDLSYFSIHA